MRNQVVLASALAFAASQGLAQSASIQFDSARRVWLLTTQHNSYAMGVDSNGALQHLYWGAPLWRIADIASAAPQRDLSSFDPGQTVDREEYPGWGGPRYYEPALKLTRRNGDRDLVLRYVSHNNTGDDELAVEMKDIKDDIQVVLHYRVFPKYGIIRRSATVRNRTAAPVTLESVQSATFNLPPGDGYRLTYLTGRWAAETQVNREPIREGRKVLESRKGHTSHNFNPWVAIDDGGATEEQGAVWFGALAWSGNWRITVEQTPYRQVRVTGGFNDFDFELQLKPGESLTTPEFFAGCVTDGFGGASRLFHRFQNEQILPGGSRSRPRPVLYNSWEATTFNVDEPGQKLLAEKAAKLGVELFVMDDGWFGQRNNDRAGLGDWFVNKQKFPNGLHGLISYVTSLGMDFGLWVEPEMVNADSDLYRAHPDWVISFPGRPRSELRHQMVLNLARDDVKEYLFNVLDKLATDYKIKYLKWDMNRSFSEPGWPEAPPAEQRRLWTKYVWNLYDLIDKLRARHPGLEIESCSGGGGRVDLGVLQRVEEVWPSDNTEAFDRLRIQEGFTQAYTPKVMSAWVTDVPNMNGRSTPLEYRFLVAMQGALGIGANLNHWSVKDSELATRLIDVYKRIRSTVQAGNLYRLMSPRVSDTTANFYVAQDGIQAVLFAFRHLQQYNTPPPLVRLRGLEAKAVYRVESVNGKLLGQQSEISGAYLMNHGVAVNLRGDYDSTAIILQRQ
jgi:alpha-galactosidase